MADKDYILQFGTGNPAGFTGLSPTFIVFKETVSENDVVAPVISEVASVGLYKFAYGPTLSITFVVDGGSSLSASDRYISGALDPIQAVDNKVGFVTDSYGTNVVDPETIFGYVKRAMEFNEGDADFDKTTGQWQILSRGASTLLREKTLQNNSGSVTKD